MNVDIDDQCTIDVDDVLCDGDVCWCMSSCNIFMYVVYHIQQDGTTPLYIAALNGHIEVLKYLVSCGAVIDKADKVSMNVIVMNQ